MSNPDTTKIKNDFWGHYLRRYPNAPFPRRFREGKAYSNPWFHLKKSDVTIKMWHALNSVGVYVTGNADYISLHQDQFDIITNYYRPRESPDGIYANVFRCDGTYDRENWDKLVDFLELYRLKYLEILTPAPDSFVQEST